MLVLTFIAVGSTYIFASILTAGDRLNYLNRIALGGVVVNIILNSFFILQWKAYGAATATILTQTAVVVLYYAFAARQFQTGITGADGLRLLLFAVFVTGINLIPVKLFSAWYINYFALTLLSILFAFVLRLVNLKEIIKLYVHNDE